MYANAGHRFSSIQLNFHSKKGSCLKQNPQSIHLKKELTQNKTVRSPTWDKTQSKQETISTVIMLHEFIACIDDLTKKILI